MFPTQRQTFEVMISQLPRSDRYTLYTCIKIHRDLQNIYNYISKNFFRKLSLNSLDFSTVRICPHINQKKESSELTRAALAASKMPTGSKVRMCLGSGEQ